MVSTVRADVRAALVTILDAYTASNPTQLQRTFPVRPASITTTDLPCAFVDLGTEDGSFDNSLRDRRYAPGFVVCDVLSDNAEAIARMDAVVDELVEHLTDYPHLITGASWSRYSITDTDVGEGVYAVRIAIADFSKLEGRT